MLKVGFIGLGAISHENVLGYLGSDDAKVVAVCDLNPAAGRKWLEKWSSHAHLYTDFQEMLSREDLDLVEILTPHHLHCQQAVACARAGVKGISLQKPMAVTLDECDRIIQACGESGTVLKVYENFVFYPVYLKAKELISGGLIGDLRSIRVHTMAGLKEGVSRPWCWSAGSWSLDLERSGTSPLVGDDGHHKFSLIRWFMERDLEKVGAWIDSETPLDAPALVRARFKPRQGDPPKYAQIDFSLAPKMILPCDFWLEEFVEIVGEAGIMWVNQCSAAGDRALFVGNQMSKSEVFPPIAVFLDGRVRTYLEDITPGERNWSSSFINSTRHFIRVIKEGREPPIHTGAEAKEIQRCTLAALLSAQENRDIYLEEITSEAERAGDFQLKTNFCRV